MKKILIVDDNRSILNFLRIFLMQAGRFEVQTLQDSTKAFNILDKGEFDILILDMDMPNVTGLDILRYIKDNNIAVTTIVLTGIEDIDLAISAMKLGTYDYMLKPIDEEKLLEVLDAASEEIEIGRYGSDETKPLTLDGLKHKDAFTEIITQDKEMLKIFHFVERFASTDNSILIWGESGTGKELIAKAIHRISKRRDKKFIAVNAGSFAQELFASEFFGHEKGAFTGASSQKKGFIEEANGGTLFLDEIGELSLPIQVKLLRVLQEEEFYRLGSTRNIKVDVRIVAATNKNLFEEIKTGTFRKDLFFRLNINSINLPPLRERKGDIELLAYYFLEKFSAKYGRKTDRISPAVLKLLNSYPFTGNIRELMNIINSAIIVESCNELKKKSLPHYFLENCRQEPEKKSSFSPKSLEEVEIDHIRKVLEFTGNNRTKSAEILGISRVNLIAKVRKYEIE
ncbi:MAG: sigma-54 dependent transcriptional regulator [Bacteroidetes bacterium]|nr:sigma-54 dependent transcriptional regulator [Bacteroidota bacterium]